MAAYAILDDKKYIGIISALCSIKFIRDYERLLLIERNLFYLLQYYKFFDVSAGEFDVFSLVRLQELDQLA